MNDSMETIAELKSVTKRFRDGEETRTILDGVNLSAQRGSLTCISRPSGCGKTTLLSIMGCLLSPSQGKVIFQGKEISESPENERAQIRKSGIGFVFQEVVLFEWMRVWENVAVPLALSGAAAGAPARASELLDELGLHDRIDSRPGALSFGERKRVALARTLISGAPLILADEPTGGLDRKTGKIVFASLEKACGENGAAVVFATHDDYFARKAAHRFELSDGKLIG